MTIFCILPDEAEFNKTYEVIKASTKSAYHTFCLRGVDEDTFNDLAYDDFGFAHPTIKAESSLARVERRIREARLVILDASRLDALVMFAFGITRALDKQMILVIQDDSKHLSLFEGFVSERGNALIRYSATNIAAMLRPKLDEHLRFFADQPKRSKVFISYCHSDRATLDRIKVHLKPLERERKIDLWEDTRIGVGDKWKEEIAIALDSAKVAVLLISADFLASDFVASDELPPLLSAAERDGVRIIPVIVKPSRFKHDARLSRFQALNGPDFPVSEMAESEKENLFVKLSEILERT